ncbi:MAG: DUF6273 domain-containing protein, partial [Clostridiales bacterium]|nr:DUF6273 domain-containing protein [Clostridiales bacterium]
MIFNKFKLTKNITKFLILFLAICFVINAMHILFLAGNHSVPQIHGYMNYNDDENFYTVDDLVIGDYIENFGHYMADGQNTWRVVDKTEDGILLRYDRAFDHIFDAPRPLGDPNRLPYNSVLSWTNGGEFPYNRESDGSNFWYESDLRGFLNGEFFEHFSEGEQNLIASVKQTQTFWRGENNSEFEDKQFGTISVATHSQVTGGTEQHVNRMDMLFLDEFNPGEQSMGMASTTDDHSKNYANLATYNIYDKVFIWDLIQAESISHSDLRNQNGLRYARGIDFEGNPVFTWTRTPFMEHGNNKGISGSALVLTGSISERTGIDMGVEAANTVRIPEGNGIYDHTSIGVLPMVYLDNSVV